jgi:SAM-dependent methyltransferase
MLIDLQVQVINMIHRDHIHHLCCVSYYHHMLVRPYLTLYTLQTTAVLTNDPPGSFCQIGMKRPTLVVDLGCGTGTSTFYWRGYADRVIGVEPNADMLTTARTSYEKIKAQPLPIVDGVEAKDTIFEFVADVASKTGWLTILMHCNAHIVCFFLLCY